MEPSRVFCENKKSGNVPVSSLFPMMSVFSFVRAAHVSGNDPVSFCLDKIILFRLVKRAISDGKVPAILFPKGALVGAAMASRNES